MQSFLTDTDGLYRGLEVIAEAQHPVAVLGAYFASNIVFVSHVCKTELVSEAKIVVLGKRYACADLQAAVKAVQEALVAVEDVNVGLIKVRAVFNLFLILSGYADGKVRTEVDLQLGYVAEVVAV